ncbi:AMP-binding protein [Streptomyces sp. NPDC007070]|uniref:AMP-binding protein n=1 Tax=Streptomyces sp. NPDC007070 TaxID=3154312 RepID=UPI0033BFBBED
MTATTSRQPAAPQPVTSQPAPSQATPARPAPPRPATALTALAVRHAERDPDALAVVDGDTTLTYGRLVREARALAAHLRANRACQVAPGDRVALLTSRSARTVVAQLALWWAGAVCVPLDPAQPRPHPPPVDQPEAQRGRPEQGREHGGQEQGGGGGGDPVEHGS